MFYKQSSSIYYHDIVFITKFQDTKLSFSIFSISQKVHIEHYNSQATNCWRLLQPSTKMIMISEELTKKGRVKVTISTDLHNVFPPILIEDIFPPKVLCKQSFRFFDLL